MIGEQEFRGALNDCVAGIKSDALNHNHSEKLLGLLNLVSYDTQRLALYEDVEAALLEGGSNATMREAAGLLAVNLAEFMDKKDRRTSDPAVQETFFRHSIRTFPESPVAARSLGYKLEQSGRELEAMELYREQLARSSTERLDLRLLLASCCAPFLDDVRQGNIRFSRVSNEIRRLVDYIKAPGTPHLNMPSPGRDLVFLPNFSWQYMGYNMRPVMEGLCWILAAMTAGLHDATTGLHPLHGWDKEPPEAVVVADDMIVQEHEPIPATREERSEEGDGRIVVGVVMERLGNHSPHRLVQGVLESMDRSEFRLVAFSRDYFEDYPDGGKAVLQAVEEVVVLEWHPFATGLSDPFSDRRLIAEAKVDILFYAAIGNTLSSHLLALGRLAPVQLAFGHGHPITSGSPGIDYFVSSELFETALSIDAREVRNIAGTASVISHAAATAAEALELAGIVQNGDEEGIDDGTNQISNAASHVGTAGSDYREPSRQRDLQKISNEAAVVEDGNGNGRQELRDRGGDTEPDYTEQLVLFNSLTASLPEVLGPPNAPSEVSAVLEEAGVPSSIVETLTEGHHLYHGLQHPKKFHPDFDPVLRGVLQSDPKAKIVLTAESKVHLPRWERTLGIDLIEDLVFLPYLPHSVMLMVVAFCVVMLDTFPWGAGITAMEALFAGVPVVTLPARLSVLPLALGQVIELGVENELVASDIEDMVNKAVKLASDEAHRQTVSAAILDKKDRLSDPRRAAREWERFLGRALRSAVHLDAG
eukprot:g18511.t1